MSASRPLIRHFRRPDPKGFLGRVAGWMLALAVIGLLLRFTFRDQFTGLATIFYATPPPVIGGLGVLAAAFAAVGRRPRVLQFAAPIALTGLGLSFWGQINPVVKNLPPRDAQRVLVWNMGSGAFGLHRAADIVNDYDADIVGLVEARNVNDWSLAWWRQNFPQYHIVGFRPNLILLTRAPTRERTEAKLADMGRAGSIMLDTPRGPLRVTLVDIDHFVWRSRAGALLALADFVAQHADAPHVILGDFNTPPDSVHYDPLRAQMQDAITLANRRPLPTWPLPLPVLALDQIWISRELDADAARRGWTWTSDHRPLFVRVGWRD